MKDKRKPTSYAILAAEKDKAKDIRLAGSVMAYTPDQARGRALDLPSVERLAKKNGSVTLYAVPERSMTPMIVKNKPRPKESK